MTDPRARLREASERLEKVVETATTVEWAERGIDVYATLKDASRALLLIADAPDAETLVKTADGMTFSVMINGRETMMDGSVGIFIRSVAAFLREMEGA